MHHFLPSAMLAASYKSALFVCGTERIEFGERETERDQKLLPSVWYARIRGLTEPTFIAFAAGCRDLPHLCTRPEDCEIGSIETGGP
jgi:hypothetical protein